MYNIYPLSQFHFEVDTKDSSSISNSKFNVSCYRSLAILTGPQARGWLRSITILESYSSQKKNIMATLLESLKSLRANPNLQLYVSNLYETT